MTPAASKGLAVALLALVMAAGGVVGYVLGHRHDRQTSASDEPGLGRELARFSQRLDLSEEQRAAVAAIMSETRSEVAASRARGQERILSILDDEQKVRYREMLERQKQRQTERDRRRDGRERPGRRGRPGPGGP